MSKTLLLIKPDAVERHLIGTILSIIEKHGFTIKNIRMEKLTKIKARRFYAVHKKKYFFDGLVEYMTSGYTIGVILESKDAVHQLRELVGSTDPKKAKRGTIRKKFAITLRKNAVHASDCAKSAKYEIDVFFKEKKR